MKKIKLSEEAVKGLSALPWKRASKRPDERTINALREIGSNNSTTIYISTTGRMWAYVELGDSWFIL